MIFTIIIIFISIIFLLDYSRTKRCVAVSAGIPGPRRIPLIGSLLLFSITNTKALTKIIRELDFKYNGFSKLWILDTLYIQMSRPEHLEIVLSSTKHIQKSYLYNILHIWLGEGLLVSSGQKWYSRRKIITPAFHFKILEEFIDVFNQQSTILVECLKEHSDTGKPFDVYPYITLAALDVICEAAMGVKIQAQTNKNCKYVQAVSDVTEIMMHRFSNSFLEYDLTFKLFAPNEKKRQDKALKELHNFTENVILLRRQALEKDQISRNAKAKQLDEFGSKKKMALLDILLQSTVNGIHLTNEAIREEVDTFMFEGHDTTASGICYALYLISQHPKVQCKLIEEISQVLDDDKDKAPTYADLQKFKYLENVIKESMRLYPPVPIIGREFTEDVTIDGHTIPAGSQLSIPIFLMMRNPEIFTDPEKFEPDRHQLENSTEEISPYAYIPFSAGARNCIGQKFAMLEMKSTISKILRNYELLPLGESPDPVINLVTKSTNGINIGIRKRS